MILDLSQLGLYVWRRGPDGLYSRGDCKKVPYGVCPDPRSPTPASRAYWNHFGLDPVGLIEDPGLLEPTPAVRAPERAYLGPIPLKIDRNTGRPPRYGPGPRVAGRYQLAGFGRFWRRAVTARATRLALRYATRWHQSWELR